VAKEKIEVWLGYGASEEQGKEISALFEGEGIPVEVRREDAYPPIGNGAGFTILVALLGMSVGAFINGYFGAAGKNAWEKSKVLLRKLKEDHLRRYPSESPTAEGQITIKDVEHRIQLTLRTDLPEEAYEKLSVLGISDQENTSYYWDNDSHEWVVFDLSGIEDLSSRTRDDPDIADG
jgi:hypothetical protein